MFLSKAKKKTAWVQAALERFERPLLQYTMSILHDLDRARDTVSNGSASNGSLRGRANGVGVMLVAFGFAVFSGLLEFLITGGKDGLFVAGKFVGRSNVADGGVEADGVVMKNKVGD